MALLMAVLNGCFFGGGLYDYDKYTLQIYELNGGHGVQVLTRIDIENVGSSPGWIHEREAASDAAKAAALRWFTDNGYKIEQCQVVGYPSDVGQGGAMIIMVAAGEPAFVETALKDPWQFSASLAAAKLIYH